MKTGPVSITSFPKALRFFHAITNPFSFSQVILPRRLPNISSPQSDSPHPSSPYDIYPSLHSLISFLTCHSSIFISQSVHAQVLKSHHTNSAFIGDRLVTCYIKLGLNDHAVQLFDEIPHKDLVSWNSLISGFSRKGDIAKSLAVFFRMRSEVGLEPNEVTIISIISACTDTGGWNEGRYIHGFVMKFGCLAEIKVVNSLINMYGKFCDLDAACELFYSMKLCNLISWNSILNVHAQNGLGYRGISIFTKIRRSGLEPDQTSLVTLLQGCAVFAILKQAKVIHGYVLKCGFAVDMLIMTSLLSLYAKSGRLDAAEQLFRELKDRDRVAWTAMLASYAVHGWGKKAIEIFEDMMKDGVSPDHVTFTHLLSACSHAGLIMDGRRFFDDMPKVYRIQPRLDHYSCMVDLLGRAGCLNDAYEIMKNMPMEPNSGVWGALLGACRIYQNLELGAKAAENLLALNPLDNRNYIMLANLYSASGLWKVASKIRSLMKDRGVVTNPGYSLVEHESKIYRFVVGDQLNPESDRIYAKLKELISKIRNMGYVPQTALVLHDVDEDIKEDMIMKHSEKLAVAFGLLVTNGGMTITITKNLRICGDCHAMMKFVSLAENRSIIIRDSKRFHHFVNGLCSCKDYW